ncbi:MAG TPA: zinc-finger domain-containing protein [Xanthobacteraceae bacterium]
MATHSTPHYHNQPGIPLVRVGAKEFMCVGALPPFDHPHIFIDMGDDNDSICPYCSTHYVYDARLDGGCEPPECAFEPRLDSEHSESGAKPAIERA